MPASDPAASQEHFQGLNEPRVERTRKHPLIDIVFIAVCGVLSGANSFAAIAEFGCERRSWFARYLGLTDGTPSDDAFARVLARLDPAAFEECLLGWAQAVQEHSADRLIAIDGKTLRGPYDRRDGKAAIPMVSAWATANTLPLGRVVVDAKSDEITATPELLRSPEISGAVVTIDAMGCQKETAGLIRDGEGDYVLAVKENQPALFEQARAAVDEVLGRDAADIGEHRTEGRGHGRVQVRRYAAFQAAAATDPEGLWRDLNAVGVDFPTNGEHGVNGYPARSYSIG